MNEETKILATVDGKPRTISESSLRRHLKLNDAEGISSLPDTELFENLSLMGYNILPNQRFTFQKGQFSHQWKFLIYTIMQCLSPKSTGFNEFSSNIATAVVCLATNRVYNFLKMIFDGMGEGSGTPTEPHHIPSPQGQLSPDHDPSSTSHPTTTTEPIPQTSTKTPIETPIVRQYSRRATQIAQSKALPLQVTSLVADEGSMQQQLQELMDICTSLQRQQTQMAAKIKDKDLEISGLKERIKAEKSTELGSNDTDEMVNVLSSMEDFNILTSGVAAVSVSPVVAATTVGVPTVSGLFPNEKVVEFEVPKKKKLQEQIDAQVAKEIDKQFTRENQRLNEQLARDSEIARLHAKKELQRMIEGLDRNNEVIAKHLQEYEQAEAELTVREKLKLINELVKYQDHHVKILKYQAQQSKPLSKKDQIEFYMSVLRSYAGWKTRHFRWMTFEEIKVKFIPVWKQLEDFVPMSSTEEAQRVKRKGLKLDQRSSKRKNTSKDVSEEDLKEMMQLVPMEEREYWKIIKLGGHTTVYQFFVDMLKQFDREDLHQLWTLVKETLSIRQAAKDKEKEL
uniref:Synaptobrevin, longin-like domain protein n=1 Tax=Tanacetum cinerariifolium TaxID=118510 RepID=A0A6L2P667_TANCI|nr:synaptobrevin, longin-like domain protein [Tanacetum cinerariifolium]